MTTYTTPETLAEEYRETSLRLIRQAEAEFEKGDLLQASEKAWGAVSQCLKSLGTPCEVYSIRDHRELRLGRLPPGNRDGRRLRIGELFSIAESIHANFYEAWMPSGGG